MSSMTAPSPEHALVVGQEIRPYPTVVTVERQAAYHEAAEVPAGLFGDRVDPSILANDTILASHYLSAAGVSGMHAGQRIIQHEPVRLGEALTLMGEVSDIKPTSKGQFVTTTYRMRRDDGSVPVTSERTTFLVDPDAVKTKGAGRPSATQSALPDLGTTKVLTPERVKGYSFEFPTYTIHFSPADAASIGLRAPIAQGLMSLTWMMEVVAADGLPDAFDLTARFGAPIYWDETVRVRSDGRSILVVDDQDAIRSTGTLVA